MNLIFRYMLRELELGSIAHTELKFERVYALLQSL